MSKILYPRITLVTPSRNAIHTIERTLRSVREQGYPNLEYICVDGESSDGTVEVIGRYQNIVSRLIRGKDKNVADALNKGFANASGDIFCYLNADDAYMPGCLRRVAEVFAREADVDVISGGCRRVYEDSSEAINRVQDNFREAIRVANPFEQPSTFWRADLHRRLGGFNDEYYFAFDWEWWVRMDAIGARFKTVKDVLSVYYFSEDNLTSRGGQKVVDEMYAITKTHGPFRGYIADAYWFLYRRFDLKGYYDRPFSELTIFQRVIFGSTLLFCWALFSKKLIDLYNWNWASKQVRGLLWYK